MDLGPSEPIGSERTLIGRIECFLTEYEGPLAPPAKHEQRQDQRQRHPHRQQRQRRHAGHDRVMPPLEADPTATRGRTIPARSASAPERPSRPSSQASARRHRSSGQVCRRRSRLPAIGDLRRIGRARRRESGARSVAHLPDPWGRRRQADWFPGPDLNSLRGRVWVLPSGSVTVTVPGGVGSVEAALDRHPALVHVRGQGVFFQRRLPHQPMGDPAQQFGLRPAAVMPARPQPDLVRQQQRRAAFADALHRQQRLTVRRLQQHRSVHVAWLDPPVPGAPRPAPSPCPADWRRSGPRSRGAVAQRSDTIGRNRSFTTALNRAGAPGQDQSRAELPPDWSGPRTRRRQQQRAALAHPIGDVGEVRHRQQAAILGNRSRMIRSNSPILSWNNSRTGKAISASSFSGVRSSFSGGRKWVQPPGFPARSVQPAAN